MKYLLQLIKAFLDGFFPIIGIVITAGIVLYVYKQNSDELSVLPLIEGLTDAYKTGWKETVLFSTELTARIVKIDGNRLDSIRKRYDFNDLTEQNSELSVQVTWDGRTIEEKLLAQGWSSKKVKSAYAYLAYVDLYMDDAINDMYTSGVSASITIAQGILESNAGRSGLAHKTNNHFGIKARPNKEGRRKIRAKLYEQITDNDFNYSSPAVGVSQHFDDNRYDRFEVYTTVLDSYKRHSKLLHNSCTVARKGCYSWIWTEFPVQEDRVDLTEMAKIFQKVSGYAPEDFFGETKVPYYAAQAAGLKMAGYATSKTYHQKLVYIIETYELWRLDVALIRATSTS